MHYLLHDLIRLPLADRLDIIEQAIDSLLPDERVRHHQLQHRADALPGKIALSEETNITST